MGKANPYSLNDQSRGFSDSKKDRKRKCLVTYDIYENKNYAYLLKLIKHLCHGENNVKSINNHVLPIKTPSERYEELNNKI